MFWLIFLIFIEQHLFRIQENEGSSFHGSVKSDPEDRVTCPISLNSPVALLEYHRRVPGWALISNLIWDGHGHDISLNSLASVPECEGRALKIMVCIYNHAASFRLPRRPTFLHFPLGHWDGTGGRDRNNCYQHMISPGSFREPPFLHYIFQITFKIWSLAEKK